MWWRLARQLGPPPPLPYLARLAEAHCDRLLPRHGRVLTELLFLKLLKSGTSQGETRLFHRMPDSVGRGGEHAHTNKNHWVRRRCFSLRLAMCTNSLAAVEGASPRRMSSSASAAASCKSPTTGVRQQDDSRLRTQGTAVGHFRTTRLFEWEFSAAAG